MTFVLKDQHDSDANYAGMSLQEAFSSWDEAMRDEPRIKNVGYDDHADKAFEEMSDEDVLDLIDFLNRRHSWLDLRLIG